MDRQESFAQNTTFESTKTESRLIVIVTSLTFIFLFLYLAMRDNSLPDNELTSIYVKLKDSPKYYKYKIKSTTYRDIILTTKEYEREFRITAMTYEATDHNAFKANFFAGDKVELKVKKSALDNLDKNTFWNNYNVIYGLSKNGYSYINLNLRKALMDKESKWAYCFVIIGLIILPYGFIKSKPLISMGAAIVVTAALELIILLIAHRL